MRVLIAGGGTGGHILPALSIADELKARYQAEIRFVGTPRGLESTLVPKAGYPLDLIAIGQLKNVSLATRRRTLLDLPRALLRCYALLRTFRPDVVIGVGGYASGPAMGAAILSRTPALAFEPNAMPGLANRIVGRRVQAAAVNFSQAAGYFRYAQVTGIPVRREFFHLPQRPNSAAPKLLVFGGSQGARVFNTLMPQIAARLLDAVPGLTILHQAGGRHAEVALAAYRSSGADPARWEVHGFLDDMPARFASADLILARSGAATVAELAAAGKPSLLVPFPQAADDHQRKNAEALVAAGGAELLIERDLYQESLLRRLIGLLTSDERRQRMSAAARTLAHPDAAERIAEMVLALTRGR